MRLRVSVLSCTAAIGLLTSSSASGKPAVMSGDSGYRISSDIALAPLAVAADTSWYGGTLWAADSNRWEAIPDGRWTFDSGVGSSIQPAPSTNGIPVGYHRTMEGWVGLDETLPPDVPFQRSTTCTISGSRSMWAGLTQTEAAALGWPGGQGYGNSWSVILEQTFPYPGSGNVTLQYAYAVDSEPGFDFFITSVRVNGGADITLKSHDGVAGGTDSVVLRQVDGTLPPAAGTITIRFRAESDGSYSDEDGLFNSTCGHTAIDAVSLSGAITHSTGFEAGTDGWVKGTPTGVGDFSDLRHINDLPPVTGFSNPDCGFQDSVLVFINPANTHPPGQFNVALSPWIDLKATNDHLRPGKVLEMSLYSKANQSPPIAIGWQYYPWTSPHTGKVGVSPVQYSNVFFFGSPVCGRYRYTLSSPLSGAEQVRVVLGMYGGEGPDPAPYIDNVRFGVFGSGTSSVPDPAAVAGLVLRDAFPNPMRTAARIVFSTPRGAAAPELGVFDVTGRIVRTFRPDAAESGAYEIQWDGRADNGRRVSPGLYFYRVSAGGFSETRKLMVIE